MRQVVVEGVNKGGSVTVACAAASGPEWPDWPAMPTHLDLLPAAAVTGRSSG